jgi:hypothetical protein
MTTACIAKTPGRSGYANDRCNCDVCGPAGRAYQRDRYHAVRDGTWCKYVDAAPAREHLTRLRRDYGISYTRVAEILGENPGNIARILWPTRTGGQPTQRIRPDTERAILTVTPETAGLSDGALTDPTGTARRIRALGAIGRTQVEIAARAGYGYGAVNSVARGRSPYVTAGLRDTIAALYREWQTVLPELTPLRRRARTLAERAGWDGPDAWTDDTIDDPEVDPYDHLHGAVTPDTIRPDYITHALVGAAHRADLTEAELRHVVATLTQRGMHDADIQIHLRWTGDKPLPTNVGEAVRRYRNSRGIPASPEPARHRYIEEERQRARYRSHAA